MARLAVTASLALTAAALVATGAESKSIVPFVLDSSAAEPPGVVTIRIAGTPRGFTLAEREKPFRKEIRLYLVRSDVASRVSSRFDRRLHFIGRIVPDKRMRGALSFVVPPLATSTYDIVFWCPGCPGYTGDRVLGMHPELRIHMPSAAGKCPVSGEGRYGNGLLSTWLPPNGELVLKREPGGTLSDKLGWLPHRPFPDALKLRGERLDAPSPPMEVLGVYWGYASAGPAKNGSWASAVRFPREGCWRITGRVQDVSLSYVVKVVAAT